jgi:hypothetical protein
MAHPARKSANQSPYPSSGQHRIAARDRRQAVRRAISLTVRVEGPGAEIAAEAIDLGLGGMFVKASETFPYAAEVSILFDRSEIGIELRLPAIVRWVTAHGFGMQFGRLGARETRALVLLLTTP